MASLLTKHYRKQHGLCCYCEQPAWIPGHKESRRQRLKRLQVTEDDPAFMERTNFMRASREHLVRRAEGGGDGENVVMACVFCNSWRDRTAPEIHKRIMLALVAMMLHPAAWPPGGGKIGPRKRLKMARRQVEVMRQSLTQGREAAIEGADVAHTSLTADPSVPAGNVEGEGVASNP
jgi:hypothetical protein